MELTNRDQAVTSNDNSRSRTSSFSTISASEIAHSPSATASSGEQTELKTIEQLQEWLQPTDYKSPGNEYMKHLAAYIPGTGEWLRKTNTFREWLDFEDRNRPNRDEETINGVRKKTTDCLWIKGIPGTGKSVFAASTAHDVLGSGADVPVLFFFFRQIVSTNHSPAYLVRDWCSQLLQHSPTLHRELHILSAKHSVSGIEMTILWETLLWALKSVQGGVLCVADALDEMDEKYWDDFIPQLQSLAAFNGNIKTLLTSRPIPRIELLLRDPGIAVLRLEPELIYPDIVTYVNVRLLSLAPDISLGTTKEQEVCDAICERARGLFLHARLMIDNLTTGLLEHSINEQTLPDSLEKLPRNLRELYTAMLAEHSWRSGITQNQQFEILSCVINSTRPLRLIELGSMVCYMRFQEAKSESAERIRTIDLKEGKDLVRASCGRLLEILDDETVSVIHHSFTEFLRDETRASNDAAGQFPIVRAEGARKTLALLCLQYLSSCSYPEFTDHRSESQLEDVRRTMRLAYPLVEYATANLAHYIHISVTDDDLPLDNELLEVLDNTFQPGKPAFNVWLIQEWKLIDSDITPLHVATSMQLVSYIKHLLVSGADVDARDHEGRTALSIICNTKCNKDPDSQSKITRIAGILLAAGSNPDADDESGQKPLHYAVEQNHVDIARLLLTAGVSPLTERTQDDEYTMQHFYESTTGDTPLMDAAYRNRTEIMKMFLPYIREDIDALYRVMSWTSEYEIFEAVFDLKSAKLDANMLLNGSTPLYIAAAQHNHRVIALLLQNKADPNILCDGTNNFRSLYRYVTIETPTRSEKKHTVIHAWAGVGGWRFQACDPEATRESFKLLVDAGADINATVRDGSTALHYAAMDSGRGIWFSTGATQEHLFTILLHAGSDPNAKDDQGCTALHVVNKSHPKLVDILVSHGADVNAKDKRGLTPLSTLVSAQKWDEESFRTLIKNGADINTVDNGGNTIAHRAMMMMGDKYTRLDWKSIQKLWDMLIDGGANLNQKNHKGQAPIHLYRGLKSSKGKEEEQFLARLRDAGVIMDADDDNGAAVLFEIVDDYRASLKALKESLKLGYSTKVRNKEGSTLLHVAVQNQSAWESGIVHHLVELGVDPKSVDLKGNTLLHEFARRANTFGDSKFTYFPALLDMGVPVNTRNKAGKTPLILAAASLENENPEDRNERGFIELFLDHCREPTVDVNVHDDTGATPIHYSASIAEDQVARLLKAGASAQVVTIEGVSPLHVACGAKESGIVGLLLSEYERQGVLSYWINATHLGKDQRSPLHIAAQSGRLDSLWYLLEYGADINTLDASGQTALHAAVEAEGLPSKWTVHLPHAAGIRCNGGIWSPNSQDQIPAYTDIVDLLINAGINAETKDLAGYTAMDLAAERGNIALVAALGRRGLHASDQVRENFLLSYRGTAEDAVDEKTAGDFLKLRDDDKIIDHFQTREIDPTDPVDAYRNATYLHILIDSGKLLLLEHFAEDARRMHGLAYMSEEDNPGTLLMRACERYRPSINILRVLIEKIGLDVNATSNRRGYTYTLAKATPLHRLAAGTHFWNIAGAKYLLERGANIEAKNAYGETPLATAVSGEWPNGYWKVETARVLLEAGADPNAQDAKGCSCLSKADSPELIRLLLEYGARSSSGLDSAVDRRDVESVKILLKLGENPNQLAENRCRYLVHEVARPSEEWRHGKDEDERSIAKRKELTELLVKYGADPFIVAEDGNTVLHTIIEEHGYVAPFWSLVNLDLETRGTEGRTLLMSSCLPKVPPHRIYDQRNKPRAAGSPDVALTLIKMGADVDAVDDLGRTALHWLCTQHRDLDERHREVFNALVERSADLINQSDIHGSKPLHLAMFHQHTWTVDRLLALGANPSEPDGEGNTALHIVARAMFGSKGMVTKATSRFQQLLSLGLDINAKNKAGETPVFRFVASRLSDLPAYMVEEQRPLDPMDPYSRSPEEEKEPWVPTSRKRDDAHVSHSIGLPMFLDAGADIFTTNTEGETLLHATAERKYEAKLSQEGEILRTFKYLMARGVDPRREDAKCRTAVDVAVACERRGIVNLFAPESKKRGHEA